MPINCGKGGVTILTSSEMFVSWGVTKVDTKTDVPINAPPTIRRMAKIFAKIFHPTTKDTKKSAIDSPPNKSPLSLDVKGRNPGSLVSIEVNTSIK